MAVYGINYDEGNEKDLGYKSVHVSYGKGLNEKKVFNSGNFVKDWFDLVRCIIKELADTEDHFVGSSSVDHFFMDGADKIYDVAYLQADENGNAVLVYEWTDWDAIQIYVPKGTKPTWAELKEMCK